MKLISGTVLVVVVVVVIVAAATATATITTTTTTVVVIIGYMLQVVMFETEIKLFQPLKEF